MSLGLANKTALIIGNLNTLAVGVAQALHEAGAAVRLITHSLPDEPPATLPSAIPQQRLDLNDLDTLEAQLHATGAAHIVILNPGWYRTQPFLQTTASDWQTGLEQNFVQLVFAAQSAARQMIAAAIPGRILFLSSIAGVMPLSETSIAGTTLTAQWALAKMAAVTLGAHGITVNVVAAGWIDQDWQQPYLQHPATHDHIRAGIPLGRIGTPQDVAALCCFLASDAAAYITGTLIPVDGGYLLTRAEGQSAYTPA